MQKLKDFFSNKPIKFYVGLGLCGVAALLSFIAAIVYGAGYGQSVYYSGWGVALPIVGVVIFLAATAVWIFFDKIPYIGTVGAVVLWLFSFLGFILFVYASYLYLSEVFYAGFSMKALSSMNASYMVCILFYLFAIIFSNVGMYMIGAKPATAEKTAKEVEA